MALEELVGPVRLADFDPKVARRLRREAVDMPLVQIAATAESQTANTMRMVRAMAQKRSRIAVEYGIDVGKTIFYTPPAASSRSSPRQRPPRRVPRSRSRSMDETEHWTPRSGGQDLAQTLDRNLAKSGSRAIETANAWEPGAGRSRRPPSTPGMAQQEGRTRGGARMLYDARIAPADTDLRDEEAVHKALEFVYEDCFWIDEDGRRILADRIWDLRTPRTSRGAST
jgi:hypothetical protein